MYIINHSFYAIIAKIENLPGSACPMGYIYKYIHMTCSLNYARLSNTGVFFFYRCIVKNPVILPLLLLCERNKIKKKSMMIRNKIKGKDKRGNYKAS